MRQKQTKPMKKCATKLRYDQKNLVLAYEAVKQKGWRIRTAASSYGVPVQTLRDRVIGIVDPYTFKLGHSTVLSNEEEETLVAHAEVMAQLGYGFSNRQFQHLAGELMYDLGRRSERKLQSNNWLYSFLRRWNHRLASLSPRKLDTARAKSATPEAVDNYFRNLEGIMEKYDLHEKPHRIYNVDETSLQPDHRPPNVIATPGSKPQSVTSPRSSPVTLIGCANALGNSLPPFFVFKGKRYKEELLKGATTGTQAVMSDSGWSNATIFKDYLSNHFLPYIGGGGTREDPVLLLFDGHASHTSSMLIEWARERHVILFVLPAHTSHVLQPLDVAVFGPFKNYFYQECANFMQRNMGQVITRYQMATLACKSYLRAMSPPNIQAAFRKTGIYPFNRDIISKETMFPCEAFREDRPLEKIAIIKSGKEAVEEFLKLKMEQSQDSASDSPQCKCCKGKKASAKPKPSGRAITEDEYMGELTQYDVQLQKPKQTKSSSIGPSTSGFSNGIINRYQQLSPTQSLDIPDTNDDNDIPCCVCGMFIPPNVDDIPSKKVINWAKCDRCDHWVHLQFCTDVRVVRRQSQFLCKHCKEPTV